MEFQYRNIAMLQYCSIVRLYVFSKGVAINKELEMYMWPARSQRENVIFSVDTQSDGGRTLEIL